MRQEPCPTCKGKGKLPAASVVEGSGYEGDCFGSDLSSCPDSDCWHCDGSGKITVCDECGSEHCEGTHVASKPASGFDINKPGWMKKTVESTIKRSKQLPDIQEAAREWLAHNFPATTPDEQFMGIVEEVGELSHAILKRKQGIRKGSKITDEDARDAVGDILIFMLNYCNIMGWDMLEILQDTWVDEVSKRDWQKYPVNGVDK